MDSNKMTAECFQIQCYGLKGCTTCDLLNTSECDGKNIRKNLMSDQNGL